MLAEGQRKAAEEKLREAEQERVAAPDESYDTHGKVMAELAKQDVLLSA